MKPYRKTKHEREGNAAFADAYHRLREMPLINTTTEKENTMHDEIENYQATAIRATETADHLLTLYLRLMSTTGKLLTLAADRPEAFAPIARSLGQDMVNAVRTGDFELIMSQLQSFDDTE